MPALAMPAATVAMFCSATPSSIKRSGNSFWNHRARVLSARSPQSTTTRGSARAASIVPVPKPSRVGRFSTSSEKIFSASFASGLSMADLFQEPLSLFFRRRLSVPVVIAFYLRHALARDRVRDDKRRLLAHRLRFFGPGTHGGDIVAVHLEHVPIKCAVLIREGLERHHVFGIPVDLNIIAVHDRGEPGESVFPCEHRRLPRVPPLLFRIAHEAIYPSSFPAHVGRRTSYI